MSRTYSEDANGNTVELEIGKNFEISLRESRMGGYKWKLVDNGEPILRNEEVGGGSSDTSVPGGRSSRNWRFTGQEAGSTQLRLQHQRSWESAPGHEFRLTVNVSAKLGAT
ncbi:MAG TPA: protease inhibitor I42 family protein [Terriglobales bacterium]|jgi:predicted secreted protein